VLKQLNPPITKGNVDVLAIDIDNLIVMVSFRIYNGKPPSPDLKKEIKKSIFSTLRYMETEGFIEPSKAWDARVGIVVYPSDHK